MKKGRGSLAFTLVELIAIILLVSVLAVVATPMVSNVVAEGRKNSFGVTCKQIFNAVEKYADFQSESACFTFDFEKNITETEMIDGVEYQPISKLQLTGSLPTKGSARYCNGMVEVYAEDGEHTCLVNEETNNVLVGTLEDVDITLPVLESITLTSMSSTITVIVKASDEDGMVVKYYYSLDGRDYIESSSNVYTFEKLKTNTEYKVYVKVENASGLFSNKMTKKITTKVINNPVISEDKTNVDENYIYSPKRTIDINYNLDNIVSAIRYFKSNVPAKVSEDTVVAVCGSAVLPGECTEGTIEDLKPGEWYKTKKDKVTVEYIEAGTLYAVIGDGTNISGTSTHVITDVDPTGPSAEISVGSVKTAQATITATCFDAETGIVRYEYSKDGGKTWLDRGTDSEYTFKELTSSTAYTFSIRCTNGSGLTATDSNTSSTSGLVNPAMEQSSQIPSVDKNFEYATQKVIKITYKNANIANPEYYFKSNVQATVDSGVVTAVCGNGVTPINCTPLSLTTLAENTWYKTEKINPEIIYAANGTLYALTSDGTNTSGTATYVISNIDITEPNTSVKITDIKTDRVTLNATCTDSESGIIKYEFSKDAGQTWVSNGTSNIYTFQKLTQGTKYEYSARCTNGTGILTSTYNVDGTTEITVAPVIDNVDNVPNSGYNYFTNRTYKITYSSTGVVSPEYYFKANTTASVVDGVVTGTCGNSTIPTTCSTTSVNTIVAGTWYKTGGTSINLSFTSNGTIYALTGDGTNISRTSTYVVSNIDTTVPTSSLAVGTIKTDRITLTATCEDTESDITKYEFSKDGGSTYVANGKTKTYTFTELKQDTEYNFAVRCTNGSAITSTATQKGKTVSIVSPSVANSANTPSSGYSYYTSRTYKATYDNTNVNSPVYYFKATSASTVASGVVKNACGTGDKPGACSSSSVTTLTANTWYKTTSLTPEVVFTANGKLYMVTGDGTNFSDITEQAVTNIDTTAPSASLKVDSVQTDRITLTATCVDNESGITKYEFSKDDGSTWTANGTTATYTFTGLTQKKDYSFAVRCTNGSSLTKVGKISGTTATISNPTFTNTSNTPSSGYSYFTQRKYKVNYSNAGITNPHYYVKANVSTTVASGVITGTCGTGTTPSTCSASSVTTLTANTWYKVSNGSPEIIFTANGTLYALTSDGLNTSGTSTYVVSDIDTSAPSVSLSTGNIKTDAVTLTATCADSESGITKYEFSKDGGSSWTSTGTTATYTFSALTSGTKYTFGVRCTNGSKVTATDYKEATPATPTKPTFSNASNIPSSGYSYYTSRVYKITYTNTGITSPTYYFKSSVSATVASGVVTGSCGTGTNPSTCSTSSVTTLVANTWYKTTSTTPSITYAANGTIYAVIGDGTNLSSTATYSVTNIDTSIPSASVATGNVKTDRVTLTASCADSESGITKYEFSKDGGSSWTANGTTASYTYTGLTSGTKYKFGVRCTNGSSMTNTGYKEETTGTPTKPTFSNTSNTPSSGYSYYTSRVYKITYTSTEIQNPVYYFKSSVSATVASGVVTGSCGTGTTPSTCSTSSVTTLAANTWYKTTSTTPSITYAANGTIYAVIGDGTNLSSTATYSVSNIDTATPATPTITASDSKASGAWHTANTTLTFSGSSSTSGITYYYGTSTSSMTTAGSSVTISSNTSGTTYYVKACNGAGTCSGNASYTVKLDKSSVGTPTITANDSKASGAWHTANTTLTFSGVSSTSGITYYYGTSSSSVSTAGSSVSITSNTSGTTYYVKACNGAGVCGSNASYTVKLDKTAVSAPTITANDSKASGAWHTANTTLTLSGVSATSGITYYYGTSSSSVSTAGSSISITSNTSGTTYYAKACNGAGVCSANSSYTVKLDKSSVGTPSITASDSKASGAWHTANYTLTLSGVSATSGITYYYGTSSSSITTAGSSISVSSNTSGTTYYVKACNGAGVCGSSNSYSAKLDKNNPSASGTTACTSTISLSDNYGLAGYAITSSTSTPSSWTSTSGTSKSFTWSPSSYGAYGTYYIHVKDASGRTSYGSFSIAASCYDYAATLSCSGGRTLSGTNCVYTYTDVSKCGCKTYSSCVNSSCSCSVWKNIQHSDCGCATYNSQQNGTYCGYNACTYTATGTRYCSSGTLYNSNTQCLINYGSPYYVSSGASPSCTYGSYNYSLGYCASITSSSISYSCPSGGTLSGTTCSIAASSSSNGCSAKTCSHSAFGCQTYATCRLANASKNTCETYSSCVSSACSCATANTCTLTENGYKTYSCPKGGTLSGTTCKFGI